MLLYFNAMYSAVFAVFNLAIFVWKSSIWGPPLIVSLLSPMFFCVWAFIEVIRLALGYYGNLSERVPWLVGFWILTLFPQPIAPLYFVLIQDLAGWFVMPLEVILSLLLALLYLSQLFVAYSANRRLVAKAAADFHLYTVDSAEESVGTL